MINTPIFATGHAAVILYDANPTQCTISRKEIPQMFKTQGIIPQILCTTFYPGDVILTASWWFSPPI